MALRPGELRQLRAPNQTSIARAMGTSQSGISRLERQKDIHISTLRAYIAALGGNLELVAVFPDADYRLTIGQVPREGAAHGTR